MTNIFLIATAETTKLQPLCNSLPSPLLPVANRPVMLHMIDMLARQGYKQLLVSLYNHAGLIESFFRSGQRWGITLEYQLQRQPSGTAGALLRAKAHLKSTIMVLPADILIDLNIEKALDQHRRERNAVTTIVYRTGSTQHWPVGNQAAGSRRSTNTGVYFLEPEVIKYIPARTPYDIAKDLIPCLVVNGLKVGRHEIDGYWNPLETYLDYQKAQYDLLSSEPAGYHGTANSLQYLSPSHKPLRTGIWVGRNSLVHPSARLFPPVFIGENCRVGRKVELGPNVVLGQNVIVDDEATVINSTVFDYTWIGRLLKVENRVVRHNLVIDIPTSTAVYIEDPFLLSGTIKSVDQSVVKRIFDFLIALIVLVAFLPVTIPLAVLLILVNGRVFEPVERVRPPANDTKGPNQNGEMKFYQLLRFSSSSKDGKENELVGTRVNRWIRKWHFHRLPELWNVLRGDLRLVGVKPISPTELLMMNKRLAAGDLWQEKIYECSAGFTGLWFIQTLPGCDREEEWIADAYYSAMHNWNTDLAILWMTPTAWFRRARHSEIAMPAAFTVVQEEG
jgi:NDP-sugar pyrophosphorylase family protein